MPRNLDLRTHFKNGAARVASVHCAKTPNASGYHCVFDEASEAHCRVQQCCICGLKHCASTLWVSVPARFNKIWEKAIA